MARPFQSSRLDPATLKAANAAARRAATLTRRIARARDRSAERLAELEAERAEAWAEATGLGMSRTEAAAIADVHHSAVDRALNGG